MPIPNPDLRARRDAILNRLLNTLEADERVRAVWLSGSLGRGTADDWSDIDLHAAINDDDLPSWIAERPQLYQAIGDPVLVMPDKTHEPLPGTYQGVLFAGPVFLDLNVLPTSQAKLSPDTRLLFDRLPLPPISCATESHLHHQAELTRDLMRFWKLAQITLKYIARGDTQKAILQYWILQDVVVNCWRLIHQPERVGTSNALSLHPVHDAELSALLPKLGASIDQATSLAAVSVLMDQMIALHPSLASQGIPIPESAVSEITRFRDTVAQSLTTGRASAATPDQAPH